MVGRSLRRLLSNIANDLTLSIETPKFDLDIYIANYSGERSTIIPLGQSFQRLTCRAGRTRFRRLYLIGACSPVLRIEALRAAVTEARSGNDLKSYEDALQLLRRSSRGSEIEFQADSAWIEKKDKQNKAETTRLEHELKGYKNNLIKESIRVSFTILAHGGAFTSSDTLHLLRWATKTLATTITALETSITQ